MSHLLKKAASQSQAEVHAIHDYSMADLGLRYIAFRVIDLKANAAYAFHTQDLEVCVVAHTGRIQVTTDDATFDHLGRRESAFDRIPTDSVYISRDHHVDIVAEQAASVILCFAPCATQRPTVLIAAEDNTVEDRGKYANQRHVHNILPDSHEASENLLVVEVYTNQGNWSSYPPHKHDQDNLPHESLLEETYYHEMNPSQGFVFQRVYTDDLTLDETMTVSHRDVVVVPKGYHPVGVPDGYDSYYLNVMAGPKKIWKFHNAKDHEWIIHRD
ncbi:5-deoxy-glucuronate isomerase [Staphylococcus agnetis]|uniref:5-deoxy-glucuronate isomerase n=1 Tax=Staphylococcus agnetis TaxID=985762 RepID=UPI0004E30D3C|nr:5-deoxy-glucuronate isomerase [Staphylococcus agnetis]KFE42102.1 IolB protein [Staphylococcus agnetis]NJH65718.1 5-deoxy-glucuronate isomerase [Staphylococcus agnetis]PTH47667.1 5-deoxy-glucuronate isomerase [Staphylococcus agnetis]PTH74514.1 5-deoxy-glucuronate isomerase [Staphylococcus agnetis]PTH75077.1 5-deoxy-glucuronate isomerase [Staphylococcus agnetis]